MNPRLIRSDLLGLFKEHKLLSGILMSGIIASFFAFQMMIGLVQYKIISSRDHSALNAFSIDFGTSISNSDKNNLASILSDDKDHKTALLINVFEDKPMLVGWKGENENRWFVLDEGRFFNQSEVSAGSNVVVISAGLYNKPDFKYKSSRFAIDNIEFQITGIGILPANSALFIGQKNLYERYYANGKSNHNYHEHEHGHEHDEETRYDYDYVPVDMHLQTEIIPFTTYQKLGYRPNIVRLEFKYNNLSEYNNIIDKLLTLFPDAAIYAPQPPQQYYSPDMTSKIIQSLLLTIFAMVNIAALFVYWLAVNKPIHTIYSICGANKKEILALISIEWGIITFIAFLGSFLLQYIISPLVKALHVSFEFSVLQYALTLVGGYILTMIFIAPQIVKNVRPDIRGYVK